MEVTFHKLIPKDLRRAIEYYESEGGTLLGDRFFAAVEHCVLRITQRPNGHHFSDGGYRRASLDTFPYHLLYDADSYGIWIAILRHDKRHPSYGLQRKRRA